MPTVGASDDTQHAPPRVRIGIETISDVVFGLALEIGAISLVARVPQSSADLTVDILAFGFSFLVISLAWFAYRRVMMALPHETELSLFVNVALLFSVSVEPFLFYVLVVGSGAVEEPAAVAFSLDIGVMMLLLSGLHFLLLAEERRIPHHGVRPATLQQLRVSAVGRSIVGAAYLASALPVFSVSGAFGVTLREDVWFAGLLLILIVQRLSHVIAARWGLAPS
jgi:uncharacterized membrane protein